ncbi:hypothetical protein PG996_008933 [Apiospora saccharicola]|uniref:2EXR domain-containing protein n=1 Tax=Apiospora saccharicola TaxID=335842 RepID=A0ABR1V1W6_9PEZI
MASDLDLVSKMENQLVISPRKTESVTESPTEFHPFVRLPIELRTQIWEELIPEIHDRIIWVREPGWLKVDRKRFTSVLLHVSPESRQIYLTRFPIALTVRIRLESFNPFALHPLSTDWYERGVVFINPVHDILAIGQPWPEPSWRNSDTSYNDEYCRENPYLADDYALLAQQLRREKPRNRIRKVIEFPVSNSCNPGTWAVDISEDVDYYG